MREGQPRGMQCLPLHAEGRRAAVHGVGDQRVAARCEVHADLVRATRVQDAAQSGDALAMRQRLHVRDGVRDHTKAGDCAHGEEFHAANATPMQLRPG